MDKKSLTETDIRTKYITPAITSAGWDVMTQIREEVFFTAGKIIVRGKTVRRGEAEICGLRAVVPAEAADRNCRGEGQ